jgi:hypothetical protein
MESLMTGFVIFDWEEIFQTAARIDSIPQESLRSLWFEAH